jgi:dTDP-4-dehydrorhamnose 3,5-epimerase-like enzyme
MSEPKIEIIPLTDSGDQRGASFPIGGEWVEFLGKAIDCHISTVAPGQTRGNHFHERKREVIIVVHRDRWTMCWDTGSDTSPQRREFSGAGAVMIKTYPGASHAVVNSGEEELHLFALCNQPYDPANPDAVARRVSGT